MRRDATDGQPALALAFFLLVLAVVVELFVIFQAEEYCGEAAVFLYPIAVVVLWSGGIASLVVANKDRRIREGGRATGFALVVAIFGGIFFIPTLAAPIAGCGFS